jgi:hypothetical protein
MNYTDVVAMLHSLRREHSDAEVVTEHIRIDDGFAVFKATITIPDGGKATGHGSEYNGDLTDYVEQAETKAIARALAALGFESLVAGDDRSEIAEPGTVPVVVATNRDQPTRPDVRPVALEPDVEEEPAGRATTRRDEQATPAQPAEPTPIPNRASPERRRTNAPTRPTPVEIGAARERPSTGSPTPFPGQSTAASPSQRTSSASNADAVDQPPLEDYSWTAFWKWAREQGYESKGGIEAFIGRQMNNLSPLEVRQLILAKRGGT